VNIATIGIISTCLVLCLVLETGSQKAFAQGGTATLSGLVYADVNKNNQRDSGEPGIAGVRMTLAGSTNANQPVWLVFTTTASGAFTFTQVPAGVYSLSELQPILYGDGADVGGSAGGNVGNDLITHIWVTDYANITGYLFGETTGSLRGSVVRTDVGITGVGISGVTVILAGADNSGAAISKTTTTDGNGVFGFTGLLSGTYALAEVQPVDYVDSESGDEAGSLSGTASNDSVTAIRLRAGGDGAGYRFTERGARVQGLVFVDVNRDGAYDASEAGLAGVRISIQDASGVLTTTQTDPTGHYTFTGLLAGVYAITQTQPTGYGSSTPNTTTLTLTTPLVDTVLHFGETGSTIGGAAFADMNRNGARDFADANSIGADAIGIGGDTGIANVTLLLTGTDTSGLQISRAVSSGVDGTFFFFGLPAGTYALAEVQPNGYGDLTDTVGTSSGVAQNDLITNIQLSIDDTQADYRFAESLGSISGQVFRDDAPMGGIAGNGVRDAADANGIGGEVGVSGVIIILTGRDANGGQVNRTATTNSDGAFTVTGLLAGRYTLVETQPGNYTDGPELLGDAGGTVFDDVMSGIQLMAGADARGYAFVERRAILSGVVYEDANRNGVRDAGDANGIGGEVGIGLVTVELQDEGGGLIGTQQTDGEGRYRFLDLRPGGTYVLRETQPSRYGDGTGNVLTHTLPPLGLAERNFGETSGSLSGQAFFDLNKNGQRDANELGEVGIVGLPVSLFDGDGGLIQRSNTDATGAYRFGHLLSGAYWVSFTVPGGMAFAVRPTGGANTADVYTVGPGEDRFGPDSALISNLAITLRAETDGAAGAVGRNRLITYTVDVTNTGPTSAQSVVVSDVLPSGLAFVSGDAGVKLLGAQTVQWDVGTLAAGAHTSIRLTAQLLGGQLTAITNVAQVQAQFVPVGIPSNIVVNSYNPNFIVLRSFEARRLGTSAVLVQWETSLERDTFAYILYRGTDENRKNAVRITPDPIPAQGTNGGGSLYAFVDEDAYFNQPYFYWLQEIEQDGDATDYGPAKLEIGSKDPGLYSFHVHLPVVMLSEL
jgi:uncharacterized repeat protein (TIGR01451 family)